MSLLHRSWTTIHRTISIDFDVNAKVSYEDFAKKTEFHQLNQFLKGDKARRNVAKKLLREFTKGTGVWFWLSQKVWTLLVNDLFETFDFEQDYPQQFLNYDEWKDFYSYECDTYLNIVKANCNNNSFFVDEKLWNARLLRKDISNKVNISEQVGQWQCTTYTQTHEYNRRFNYLIFLSVLNDEPYYLVSDETLNIYHVVDSIALPHYIEKCSIVSNISTLMRSIYSDEVIEAIQELKDKHQEKGRNKLREDMLAVPLIAREFINADIHIRISNGLPEIMTAKTKTNNTDYFYRQEKLGRHNDTTTKVRKGKKVASEVKKIYKYK